MTKNWAWLYIILVGLSHHAIASNQIDRDIEKQLALPESQIDVGIAALTFAKEIYPNLDVAAYSKKIDLIAANTKLFIDKHGRHDPENVIRAFNSYFYKAEGFHYDYSKNARTTQENYFLNGLLDTKKGICVTMPMLYMAVAQRLGYPVYAVTAPEHFFLRYLSPFLREQNIEATKGGGYSSDADYTYRLNINKAGLESGAYLRTMTNREFLSILLQQNAIVLDTKGNHDKAIRYFEKAVEVNPRGVYGYINLRNLYSRKSKKLDAEGKTELATKYWNKAQQFAIKTKEMGFVTDPDANTRGAK